MDWCADELDGLLVGDAACLPDVACQVLWHSNVATGRQCQGALFAQLPFFGACCT